MAGLQKYIETAQTELFERLGAFFAFSNEQFAEKRVEGVEYYSLPAGMICPKGKCKELVEEMEKIHEAGIKKDIEENGEEKIIIRELYNHECFYTGDISDCVDSLEDYNFEVEKILFVYNKEYPNWEKHNS